MREYKLTDDSINSYMRNKLPGMAIIGETADSFIVQSGRTKSTRQVKKNEVENFGITEGYIDNGIKPKENENFGMKAARLSGEAKSKGATMTQIQDKYNNDPVYQAALKEMDATTREQYRAKMNGATNDQRVQMVKNVRDNYAQKKYDADVYARGQAHIDRAAESLDTSTDISKVAKGNKSYPKGSGTNQ